MDDSFIGYRSKQKQTIISSDEDDDDVLESSQTSEPFFEKTRILSPGIPSSSQSDSTNFDPCSPQDADYTDSQSGAEESENIEDSFTGTSLKHHDVNDASKDEIEESDESTFWSKSSSKRHDVNDFSRDIEESDGSTSWRPSSKLEQHKSHSSVPAADESEMVVLSSFARDSVDLESCVEHEVESSVQESLKWNWNEGRSMKNVQAELSAIVTELEKKKDLLSSVNLGTVPDDQGSVTDSILSLEFIKKELQSELKSFSPNAELVSTPKRSVMTLSPVKKDIPVFIVSDDDSVNVKDDTYDNENTADGGISIPNIRTILKEKVLSNASDIINSPPNVESTDRAWSDLPTTDSDTQGFGKRAMKTYTTQQSLTVETLHTLHSALKACPTEETLEEDPYGLKVELMPHQKHALAWLLWREREKPSGGILADDMGLGKTLTMISLVLKSQQVREDKENAEDSSDDDDDHESKSGRWLEARGHKMHRGGTLVVCPASLVVQWEKEIQRRCEKGLLSVLLYHGTNRETRVKRIARKDIVITTYNLMSRESGVETAKNCTELKSPGPLHCIKWKRIILDEAHIVRNHKSQTAMGVFELPGKHRWCLTGTPIQNKELDLFSLLKFLRCSPFDDLVVWKRWVDNKNAAGMQRLATMMKSLMLRRTKEQLHEKGALQSLPKKEHEIISVKLDPEEIKIYKKVALFSSTLFMQFLGQRAEKDQLNEARWGQSNLPTWEQGERPDNQFLSNEKIVEMYRKMKTKNTEIKSHQILVLLLRLRQICCHPGLIKEMLQKEDFSAAGVEDETDGLEEDLFSAMHKLAINNEDAEESDGEASAPTPQNGSSALSPDNPILEFSRPSSKVRAVLDVILEKVMETEDKAVVVSQWTSMLNIIRDHLRDMGVKCEMLSGSVPVAKRMEMVDDFNGKRNKFKVLLLSLTAGGVGLNLIGGNHLFLIDVHWNPQLEAQACDRVYRVGQTKPVHIYKFVCADTVEERIRQLQDRKLAIADNVLTGTKNTQASKLTLQDLKMLFGVGLPQPGSQT